MSPDRLSILRDQLYQQEYFFVGHLLQTLGWTLGVLVLFLGLGTLAEILRQAWDDTAGEGGQPWWVRLKCLVGWHWWLTEHDATCPTDYAACVKTASRLCGWCLKRGKARRHR